MDLMGDDYELDGDDVLGDELESDELGMSLVGDDVLGAAKAIVRRAAAGRSRGRSAKPKWRSQLAPGVPKPGYGVYPIPLTPRTNNGIFTDTISTFEYSTVAQIPFRGERLVTRVARTGASAAGALVFANNGVHIGIRPQVGVLGPMNLEDYSATAFGVRMVMQPATQGAEIRVFAFITPNLSGTDTLALSIQILGRVAA